MDIETARSIGTVFAILLGAILGCVAIGAACIVWVRKMAFGYGGSALCVTGLVLLGLSVWQSVNLRLNAGPMVLHAEWAAIVGDIKRKGDGLTINDRFMPVPALPDGPTQIGFWTPSAKTKETADASTWEIFESDKKLDDFADRLMTAKIIEGYRRYEVTGAGKEDSRRIGAWWVSTKNGEFKLRDFLRAYSEFWKNGEDATYMEILPLKSSGGYQAEASRTKP
jgi:hypothetical protein